MDLRDSKREAAFRAEARAFLAQHAPAKRFDYFDEHTDDEEFVAHSRRWQRTLWEHGWAALLWPEQYGGRGLGPIEQIIWNQELSRGGIGESLFVAGIGLAGPTIIAHGTDGQKARYLEPLLRGDEVWCQLFSEPAAGSDLAAVAARAIRDGDDWIVKGQKTWSSGAHYADWGMLLTRTDPAQPKHKGITYFLLDMRSPGIEVRPLREMTGAAHFNEVFLDQVRVPDAQRLGPVDGGWTVAKTTLMNERMAMGGVDLMFSFEDLRQHACARSGRLDPVLRDEIARLYVQVKTLELLNARVVTKLGRGMIPDSEASVMKLALARIVTRGTELGLRLDGPRGALRRGRFQNQFLFAPSLHIAGGTDEIQRNIASERVLGLPRDPGPDRDTPFEQLPRGRVTAGT
jgi:alkylation response protein AidB-like acyl-CoA dehydrogenase